MTIYVIPTNRADNPRRTDNPSRKLTLVGVNHGDRHGEYRLMNAISDINPEYMTVEMLPGDHKHCHLYKPKDTKMIMDFASKKLPIPDSVEIIAAEHLMAHGFEGRVVELAETVRWPRTFNIDRDFPGLPEETVDLPNVLQELGSRPEFYRDYIYLQIYIYGKLTSSDEFSCGLPESSVTREISRCIAIAMQDEATRRRIDAHMYETADIKASTSSELRDNMRDSNMANEIEDIWRSSDVDIMHVGGLSHIFGNYNNLYERLMARGLNPTRHKLCEFGEYYEIPWVA